MVFESLIIVIGFSDTAEDTPAAGDAAILATTVADAAVGDSTVAAASALVDVDAVADGDGGAVGAVAAAGIGVATVGDSPPARHPPGKRLTQS